MARKRRVLSLSSRPLPLALLLLAASPSRCSLGPLPSAVAGLPRQVPRRRRCGRHTWSQRGPQRPPLPPLPPQQQQHHQQQRWQWPCRLITSSPPTTSAAASSLLGEADGPFWNNIKTYADTLELQRSVPHACSLPPPPLPPFTHNACLAPPWRFLSALFFLVSRNIQSPFCCSLPVCVVAS